MEKAWILVVTWTRPAEHCCGLTPSIRDCQAPSSKQGTALPCVTGTGGEQINPASAESQTTLMRQVPSSTCILGTQCQQTQEHYGWEHQLHSECSGPALPELSPSSNPGLKVTGQEHFNPKCCHVGSWQRQNSSPPPPPRAAGTPEPTDALHQHSPAILEVPCRMHDTEEVKTI